ncbi:prenyl cysteine carboxyl methyltransferas-like protein Ste14 [Paraphoma chrysanthemicola]|uniref:Protein-S-isoprenylcysteine O-methyltransferase n=1 Tax=Paraphoma chrysanthemicola TaxID=798071 RepID=A0A8K0QXL5_9PLEO|nr:prenyl cysteine carboxyl methyltransferas-like protein Ste14 [Paraphoma chrysanthemicola]
MSTTNGSLTGAQPRAPLPDKWSPEIDVAHRRSASPPPVRPSPSIALDFYPNGKRSLAGIALRAFLLGSTFILGLTLALYLALTPSRLWRPFAFLSILSVFHFLEFYTTSAYNTPVATISSFLLSNGSAYRQAHTLAFIETCVTSYFLPGWQARVHPWPVLALGIVLVVVGQGVRSTAMVQAGTNFNHNVQSKKNAGHELVTSGLYTYFRHPSYFGFFWWGVGTQLVLGNTVCFVGYVGVLWYFFSRRIAHEEEHLVEFFGAEYKAYRARTKVWIPFI